MNAETVNALRIKPFTAMLACLSEGGEIVCQYADPEGWEVTLYRRHPGDRLRRYFRKLVDAKP